MTLIGHSAEILIAGTHQRVLAGAAMTGGFFALAFTAAVNPSLLAVDLAVLVNRRPRAMLWCVLLGGVGMAVLIGLVDVLVVKTDLVRTQGSLSPAADLALGLLLLAVGMLLVTSRFRRKPKPAPDRGSADKSNWMQRALRQPVLGWPSWLVRYSAFPVRSTSPHCIFW